MAAGDPPPRAQGQTLSSLGQAQLDAQNLVPAAESLERAIPLLREAESVPTPQQADAWVALGRVRLEQGQFDEAQRWLSTAAGFWEKFAPDNVFGGEAAFWYAQSLVATGQTSPARQQLLRATQLLKGSTWPIYRELLRRGQAQLAGKPPVK
jgi:TolA-binding protein